MNSAETAWYERERTAFIAWWEMEGKQKFGADPTLAAGAGWFARAERAQDQTTATVQPVASQKEDQ